MAVFFRFLGLAFSIGFWVFLVVAGVAGYYLWQYSHDLPDYAHLQNYEPAVMTRVHASDGSLLAEYAHERRLHLPYSAMPARLVNAFISAEDKNFFSHTGVDLEGVARASVNNLRNIGSGKRAEGASTITQQVAKNFLLTSEQSMERKVKEALISLRLEQAYSKEKILELYLNEIYLGLGSYGVSAAALNFFGKSVGELELHEIAYLAALPKAPNNYHPVRYKERAEERRNWVIDRMVENGYADEEEAEKAKKKPLEVTLRATGAQIFAAEYFSEEVRRELLGMYGEKKLYGGGMSVRTTLDPKLQQQAKKALVAGLVQFDRRRGWRGPVATINPAGDWGKTLAEVPALSDVAPWRMAVVLDVTQGTVRVGLQPVRGKFGVTGTERIIGMIAPNKLNWVRPASGATRRGSGSSALAAGDVVYVSPIEGQQGQYELQQVPEVGGGMVVMDQYTGRVLALVGGFSYAESVFNRATQAQRQPGSSFKPLVYATALDNGYTPASVVVDGPLEIDQGNGQEVWKPENYSNKFYGPSTLRLGIEQSRNAMTVRLSQDMGMPLVVEYARRFGVYDNMPPYLSMALGAGETTVLKMTTGYSIIANGGIKVRPTLIDRIQDRYGKTIFKHDERVCAQCKATFWNNQDEPELVDNRERVLDAMSAFQITSMMEGVIQRGTGTVIRDVGKPLAGKTGTTNDEKDAWFVGFSPDIAVGLYLGYDKPRPMGEGETGGHLAAPVFRDFMKMALAEKPAVPFRAPEGMKFIRIDAKSGLRTSATGKGTIMEAFKPNELPVEGYSLVGTKDDQGRDLTVNPEADRAVGAGTGGLY